MSDAFSSQAGLGSYRPVIVLRPTVDGTQAAAERVRAYVTAQAEEDARTGVPTAEIAWAVPDRGSLTPLAVADLGVLVDAILGGA